AIDNYKRTLDDVGLDNYQRLMSNERFKGRRAMLKDLKNHLKDFQDNTIL
ncbi:MAG: sigma-70 family RNA polymerase sigma factor, partial [Streptococcus sp.]